MHFIYLYFSHLFLSLPIYLFQNKIKTYGQNIAPLLFVMMPYRRSIDQSLTFVIRWEIGTPVFLCNINKTTHTELHWYKKKLRNPISPRVTTTLPLCPQMQIVWNRNQMYLPKPPHVPTKTKNRNANAKINHTQKKNNINLAARCTLRSRYAPNNTLGIRQE